MRLSIPKINLKGKNSWLWIAGGGAALIGLYFIVTGRDFPDKNVDMVLDQIGSATHLEGVAKGYLPDMTQPATIPTTPVKQAAYANWFTTSDYAGMPEDENRVAVS